MNNDFFDKSADKKRSKPFYLLSSVVKKNLKTPSQVGGKSPLE
jgi:hypothetical protein